MVKPGGFGSLHSWRGLRRPIVTLPIFSVARCCEADQLTRTVLPGMEPVHVSTIVSKAEESPTGQSVVESWSVVPVDDRLQNLGSVRLANADNGSV